MSLNINKDKNKDRSCCYIKVEKKRIDIDKIKDRSCTICSCFSKIQDKDEENRKNLEDYFKKINTEIKESKNINKINNPPGGINFE